MSWTKLAISILYRLPLSSIHVLLPLKVDRGYVFTPDWLSLFVCEQDISKGCGWIWTILWTGWVCDEGKLIRFLVKIRIRIRLREFLIDSSPLRDRAKPIFRTISQKVVDGFGWNWVDMLGVWQGRNDSILVKIRIRIRVFFKRFFTIERSGQKRYIARYLKNVFGLICSHGSGITWWRYALQRVPF